jgi:putative transposase
MAATVEASARTCRSLGRETPDFVTSQYELQAQSYRAMRERFGLSANLAIRAIARVATHRKAAKATSGSLDNYRDGSVQDDEPIFCLYGETASLTLIAGRRRIPLALGDHQRGQLARPAGERRTRGAHLSMKRARGKTTFFLKLQIEVECDQRVAPVDWIGDDRGRTDSLHTSHARAWSGTLRKTIRDRHHRVRRSLQKKASKGTSSTRRRRRPIVKRLSGQERRFLAAENHAISKRAVEDALEMRAGICLEEETGIRGRTIVAQAVRRDHSGWRFFQLRTCVAYEAHIAGIRVEIVQPHSTGQSCSRCGPLGTRRGKDFACEACADRNAADNLRLLGMSVTHPGGLCCSLPQGTTTGGLESPRLSPWGSLLEAKQRRRQHSQSCFRLECEVSILIGANHLRRRICNTARAHALLVEPVDGGEE